MALPEETRKLVTTLLEAFCEERVPAHLRDRILLSCSLKGNSVTLYEERVFWRNLHKSSSPQKVGPADPLSSSLEVRQAPTSQTNAETSGPSLRSTDHSPRNETNPWMKTPIAQFRFDPASCEWLLYCKHRDERWHEYIDSLPTRSFIALLSEVDEDPTCIFWG